jgi:hypothetical protein
LPSRKGSQHRVPDLTSPACIKLNEQILLLAMFEQIACTTPDMAATFNSPWRSVGRRSLGFAHNRATSLASESTNENRFGDGSMFTAIDPPETQSLKPAGVQFWHLWTVIFPRRTITGRLVRGRVWRRHDGRRWQYKKFIEYDQDGE